MLRERTCVFVTSMIDIVWRYKFRANYARMRNVIDVKMGGSFDHYIEV